MRQINALHGFWYLDAEDGQNGGGNIDLHGQAVDKVRHYLTWGIEEERHMIVR